MNTMPKPKPDPRLAEAVSAAREAEAAKTNRLRALRLEKEAADKEAAAREAAAATAISRARRRQRPPHAPATPVSS